MARLPIPGGDDNTWGNVLNEFLSTAHNSDGSIKDSAISGNADIAANTAARHTHSNQAVLDNTTASFTTADETKLDGIQAGAQVNEVTLAGAQTLTNKTISGSSNTITNIGTASLSDRAATFIKVGNSRTTPKTLGSNWAGFGDSHMMGSLGPAAHSYRGENSWFEQFMLLKAFDDGVKFAGNLGFGGTTTAWGLSILGSKLDQNPHVDTLFLGHGYNDRDASITVAQSAANMRALAQICLDRDIMPVICDTVAAHAFADAPTIEYLAQLRVAYRRVAQSLHVPFVSIYDGVVDGASGKLAGPLGLDTVHMNVTGAKTAAEFARHQLDDWHKTGTLAYSGYDADPMNLINGGNFSSGLTGATYSPPTGWGANSDSAVNVPPANISASIVAPSAGEGIIGNWFRVQVTNITGLLHYTCAIPFADFTNGDFFEVTGRIKITSAFTNNMTLQILVNFPFGSETMTNVVDWQQVSDGTFSWIDPINTLNGVDAALIVRIGPKTGTALPMASPASGTFQIGNVMVRNLNRESTSFGI